MAKGEIKRKLSGFLKEILGRAAPMELLKEIDPDLVKQLQAGKHVPTIAELLAKKVIKLALDPLKANQWAVELIWDRTEGKPVQGSPPKDDGRITEERLSDLTTEHLNSLAASFAKGPTADEGPDNPENVPAGPAAKLLDLHKDGAADPEGAGGEPAVAAAAEGPGGGPAAAPVRPAGSVP